MFYFRCFVNGVYVVEECLDNYMFDVEIGQCKVNELCENRLDGYILLYFFFNLFVNQFMQCVNGCYVVGECFVNKIFDCNLMLCVEVYLCVFNGVGYMYIMVDIGDM